MSDVRRTVARFGWLRITLLAAAPVALLLACSGGDNAPVATDAAAKPLLLVPADLVTVSTGSISGGVKVTGTLAPLNRTTINARAGGVMLDVRVRAGETVTAGQVLAHQDPADAGAQLAQAEAQLTSAQVDLKLIEALEQKKTELYKKNYLSEVDWAAAKGETEVKRAQVQVQEAAVAIARRAMTDNAIVAPINGIVAERHVEPGTRVAPGQTLFTLVDLGELELAAAIPARDVPQVRVGSAVVFTVDGYGSREFRGQVVRVNPMATSGSRTITVYATVANPDRALRGGMFANGRIAVGSNRKSVLRIPDAALRSIDGKEQVWVVRNQQLVLQEVAIGSRDTGTGLVEVRSGLTAGEQVVVTPIGNRKAGTPVEVASPQATPQPAATTTTP